MKRYLIFSCLVLLYYVITLACSCLGFFHPFLWVYSSLTCAVLGVWPYCKLLDREAHFGTALTVGAACIVINLLLGEGDLLYIGIAVPIGIVAETVRKRGGYASPLSKVISYMVLTLMPLANTLRMWVDSADAMNQTVEEMGEAYAAQMQTVLSPWLLAAMIAATLILAAVMGLVYYRKEFYQYMLDNCSKPQSNWFGTMMLKYGMNLGHRVLTNYAFKVLRLSGQERDVLDIGCGGGYNIATFLRALPKATVQGLDYSEKSVEVSRKVNHKAVSDGRCIVQQGNVAQLPFDAESFDVVSAFETIYFWPDVQACFKGIHRILRPEGRFMVVGDVPELATKWASSYEGMHVYSQKQVSDMMLAAGFRDVQVTDNGVAMVIIGKK